MGYLRTRIELQGVNLFQIWRYGAADENLLRNIYYSALEQTQIDVQTLKGQMEPEVLLAGSIDDSFRYKWSWK
ncbi:hypothetical protein V6Z12_A08G227700 [Gossypium hirsutum]